jgi:hypothetical protein
MSDHIWPRGLWFTIKFINGTNFWEEHEPFGIQQTTTQPTASPTSTDTVQITHDLQWTSKETGLVLLENRRLKYQLDPRGFCCIDWSTTLNARQDLLLDRTPYTTWGGYGGLSFRSHRQLHDAGFILPDGGSTPGLAGQTHDWVMMHAKVDGGADARIAIGMIDHPTNPRSPTPWYCKVGNGFNYMNAAFLFHEPMQLAKGQSLSFQYRFVYRDGVWDAKEFQAIADEFRCCPVPSPGTPGEG